MGELGSVATAFLFVSLLDCGLDPTGFFSDWTVWTTGFISVTSSRNHHSWFLPLPHAGRKDGEIASSWHARPSVFSTCQLFIQ